MIWTVAECDTNIAILKQKITDALGSAERETFYEGQTKYEFQNLIDSLEKQLVTWTDRRNQALIDSGQATRKTFFRRAEYNGV